jgi:catechol 2,3-dioxygenase
MLHDVTIERVALRVADAERSLDFYTRLLDAEPPLELITEGVRAERAPRGAAGLFHTAFLFSEQAALGAALRRIAELRIPLTGASDHGVSEALYLDDPDGNGIELYWDRARELWPEEMFTAPLPLEPLLAIASPGGSMKVGHVHFKASNLQATTDFWLDLGMELKASLLDQASFLSADGYHHHVGANVWMSLGQPPAPRDLPGIDRVVLSASGVEPGERVTPEDVVVEIV